MWDEGDYIQTLYHSFKRAFARTFLFLQLSGRWLQTNLKTIKRKLPLFGKRYAHSFPAVHLHKDIWTSLPQFTSELLVSFLVIGVAGFNIWTLYVSHTSDSSLAAKLLSYHSSVNPKLYLHNSMVKTVVVGNNPLVAEAFADNAPANSDALSATNLDDGSNFIVHDAIVRPNPDSIKTLIAKQFQVHEVQKGETLLSIALQYHLNRSTLQWANKLPDNNVKPGWQLLIPPIDGVAHMATSNDTLPDLAKKYHGNLDTIISYNGLENAEDISAGDIIMIPGGYIDAPPAPKAKSSGSSPALGNAGSTHIFPKGYCTYYVAKKVKITFGGDAKYWLGNAKNAGYETGSKPSAGAVVVTSENKRWGHVAYVERVTDSYIEVSEMNFDHWNRVDTRRIPLGSKVIRGYIYPKY